MKKLAIAVGFLALSAAPMFGTSTYAFLNSRAANQNSEVFKGVTEDLGPYGGSIGTSITGGAGNLAVNLFCDDYADGVGYGTGWAVNVTAVNSANLSNTRFGSANNNSVYPTGTALYEQMAWLYTQVIQPGQSILNQDALDEAAWFMTGNTRTDVTPTVTATNTGTNKTYLQWIALAQANYNTTATGYATPDYSKWYIVTDVTAAGNTKGTGKQEFLAYYTSGSPTLNGGNAVGTPEPATCLMLGSGLIVAGLIRRKKSN